MNDDIASELVASLEHAMEGVARIDPSGCYTFISRVYAMTLGYEPAELLGQPWSITVHPEDLNFLTEAYRAMLAEGHVEAEARGLRKGGATFFKRVVMVALRSADGALRGHYCFCKDISAQRKVESALRVSEERFRAAAEGGVDALFFLDGVRAPSGELVDLRFIDCNARACALLDRDRDALVGAVACEAFPELRTSGAFEACRRVIESGERIEIESLHVPWPVAGGCWWRVQVTKVGEGVAVAVRDVTERKVAEEEGARLREQAAAAAAQANFFRSIADAIPQIVWTTKADGVGEFFSERWRAYTGLTLDESGRAGWAGLLHPDDVERAQRAWQHALDEGKGFEVEYRLRRFDGVYRWQLVRALPLRDEAGAVVRWFGTCTDIEAQKRGEEERRARDEHLRLIADVIPQNVWAATPEGKSEFTNRRWQEYAGLSAEQMRDDGWAMVLHPDDAPRVGALWRDAIERQVAFEFECRFRRHDGAYRWFLARGLPLRDAEGHVVRWFGTNTDIDEQKRAADAALEANERLEAMVCERTAELAAANDALRREMSERRLADEARARLAAIVESSPDAIFRVDGEGCVESWNDGAERLYGWPAAVVMGRPAMELVHPSCHEQAKEIGRRLLGGSSHEPHEIAHVNSGGGAVPVAVSVATIRDGAGGLAGLSFVVRDISAVKEAERRLRESLREKEVLLMEVHHRVKNNLQVICSLLSLQGSKLRDPEALAMFGESENRVRAIALAHEKLYQSNDLARINFAEHARGVVDNLIGTYGQSAPLPAFAYELDEVWLGVDQAVPCGLIINELVSNALKHAFRGREPGRVRVSLRREPGGGLALAVGDDGVGLPASFDVRRTRSLGLKLVATLTRQVGGELRADSSAGASFEVRFVPARALRGVA